MFTDTLAPGSLRDALRALRPIVGDPALDGQSGAPLEQVVARADQPVVAACTPLEPAGVRVVPPAPAPLVAAFLDGVQRSRVLGHLDGSPIVHATVAAAVRERTDRRLTTWESPALRHLLLASRRTLGSDRWQQLQQAGLRFVDVDAPDDTGELPPEIARSVADPAAARAWHPHAVRARALARVALERERLERQLAATWCERESRWLWIDGGIAGNVALHAAAPAFGVVKSHATLYGDDRAVRAVLTLREGERSPAFLVGHHLRRAVASWYLRLHRASAHDPLFGLVRVEVAPSAELQRGERAGPTIEAFSAHADRLSAAILLERHPVSLPDARWHTLAYGVHAVETYLKSLLGP